jgi:hypothetical protein
LEFCDVGWRRETTVDLIASGMSEAAHVDEAPPACLDDLPLAWLVDQTRMGYTLYLFVVHAGRITPLDQDHP